MRVTPHDRKIRHTVRSTCVYVRKLRQASGTRMCFIEGYTEGSQDRTHGKVSSTYVYVHKRVEEKCRIARRSGRTHRTQYFRDVGSNSELVNVIEMRDHKHGKLKHFEIYAHHGICVTFSQKSAEILKNNTQDTADRKEDFRAPNLSS